MKNWGEKLEEKIRMLPDSPGCYLMKNREGTIIYVGKAVNLKNRVRSYFRDTAHTPKVEAMMLPGKRWMALLNIMTVSL